MKEGGVGEEYECVESAVAEDKVDVVEIEMDEILGGEWGVGE